MLPDYFRLLFLVAFLLPFACSQLLFTWPGGALSETQTAGATFIAQAVYAVPISGPLVYHNNTNCDTVNPSQVLNNIVLYDREDACAFDYKIYLFQAAGARGVVINIDFPNSFVIPMVAQNYLSVSNVSIPVLSIGYETANIVKEHLSQSAVVATFGEVPPEGINNLVLWNIYFFGIAFPLLTAIQLAFIVINKTIGGSQSELICVCIGFVSALLSSLANYLDMFGCQNSLPRILQVLIWNCAIVTLFLYLYFYFWVWFRALIAGTEFDNHEFLKKARIVMGIIIGLNFAAELVFHVFLARTNDWLLLYRITNSFLMLAFLSMGVLLFIIGFRLRARILKSMRLTSSSTKKSLLRSITLGGVPFAFDAVFATLSLIIYNSTPSIFGKTSFAIFMLWWKVCFLIPPIGQFYLWALSLAERRKFNELHGSTYKSKTPRTDASEGNKSTGSLHLNNSGDSSNV